MNTGKRQRRLWLLQPHGAHGAVGARFPQIGSFRMHSDSLQGRLPGALTIVDFKINAGDTSTAWGQSVAPFRSFSLTRGSVSNPIRRIAISTGGGDVPALNAVIRSVVLSDGKRGWECYGIREGFNGILHPGIFRIINRREAGTCCRLAFWPDTSPGPLCLSNHPVPRYRRDKSRYRYWRQYGSSFLK